MRKIKIMSVFGTRPEGIKMCPLIKVFEKDERIESIVCVTAQHREMLDAVLEMFDIKADYDLDVMLHGQTIIDVSNKVLSGVDKAIKDCNPDIILVHGDTSTTLNGALAAFYNKITIGHVEAGLRSGDIYSPFPEEANRRLTGAIANLHFAATENNKKNLNNENIKENIFITGNTVIDALMSVINKEHKFNEEILNNIDFNNNQVILLTTHRRENWGTPMESIFKAIKEIVKENENVKIIFPMHKNPIVRDLAKSAFSELQDKVFLIEPLEYIDFTNLMAKCYLIMTDSGGVQEEGPALGKPVLVLRTETERPEAVKAGTVKLVGIEQDKIREVTNKLIRDKNEYDKMSKSVNPYGDGKASIRIKDSILFYFGYLVNSPKDYI